MLLGNALRVIQELTNWYNLEGTLSKANDLLGAPHGWLFKTLQCEQVITPDGRPTGAVSCQQILDIVLLHLAMRKGFESLKKGG